MIIRGMVVVLLVVILLVPVLCLGFKMVGNLSSFLAIPRRILVVIGPKTTCTGMHVPLVMRLGMIVFEAFLILTMTYSGVFLYFDGFYKR